MRLRNAAAVVLELLDETAHEAAGEAEGFRVEAGDRDGDEIGAAAIGFADQVDRADFAPEVRAVFSEPDHRYAANGFRHRATALSAGLVEQG